MSYDAQEQSTASAQAFELFKFVTAGATFFLTSSDQAINYLGATYEPTTLERTEFEYSNEVTTGQMHVKLPNAHAVAQLLIPYLTPSPMTLQVFGGHFGDPEVVLLFQGTVASATFDDMCDMTVNSDAYILQRRVPKQGFQMPCVHIFGDAGCGINIDTLASTGTVATVSADGITVTSAGFVGLPFSLAAGYFKVGNEFRMIVTHAGNTITLLAPIAGLAAGAAYKAVPGCQLTYAACQAYNNVPNFLGFDLTPITNPFTEAIS
jgi:uncharacterized phage protein (TIGR02218 family)